MARRGSTAQKAWRWTVRVIFLWRTASISSIRKITPVDGDWVVSTIAGLSGSQYFGGIDGTNNVSRFHYPCGITIHTNGVLFVVDNDGQTVSKDHAHRHQLGGDNHCRGVSRRMAAADGTNSVARFDGPRTVTVDSGGRLYVTDQGNQTIRKLTPLGTNWVVTTIAGLTGVSGSANGTNSAARFFHSLWHRGG